MLRAVELRIGCDSLRTGTEKVWLRAARFCEDERLRPYGGAVPPGDFRMSQPGGRAIETLC